MNDIKKMNIKEFRERGYLQEVNRRFLHPLGLALEVNINDDVESIGGVWDYRDDEEGIYYNIKSSDKERKERFIKNKNFIDNEFKIRSEVRKSKIGFKIEPIEESTEVVDDRMLSLAAEYENFKKRVQKEKEDIVTNTKVKTLTSILDMDNDISIALKNVEDEGVRLIANKLKTFLKAQGIEEIQTDNYDEDLHEVISIMEIGESKIIDVINKGYTLNGKPFRYPKVILGK